MQWTAQRLAVRVAWVRFPPSAKGEYVQISNGFSPTSHKKVGYYFRDSYYLFDLAPPCGIIINSHNTRHIIIGQVQ